MPVGAPRVVQNRNSDEEEKAITPATKLEEKKAESMVFERKLITARELGLMEEKYYRD